MIDKTNDTGILVTLDQEKEFNRVDHEFLMHTLSKFVFLRIICNDKLTDPVFLGRGVRQGCPLSPLLYVLVSTVLSTQIGNCDILGFWLAGAGSVEFKVSQYTDDATNSVKAKKSLSNLLKVVGKYEKGEWRDNGASPFGLKWVKKMRILGVYFSNGQLSIDNDNWKCKLDKLQSVINLWSSRELFYWESYDY